MEKMTAHLQQTDTDYPLIIGSPVDLQWAVIIEHNRARDHAIVIGPIFYHPPLEDQLRSVLGAYASHLKSHAFMSACLELFPQLPVFSYAIFSRYVLMVHNTVNEQQLSLSELIRDTSASNHKQEHFIQARDRVKVYQAEKAMLQMVREGDINYQNVFKNSMGLSPGVPVHGRDPLRQAKISITVFTSLVCRAAMEGGLSPEIAYPLGDSYIQAVEDCRDSGELSALAHAMYHDFIYRVHQLHANPNYSHTIQKCCDYIALSLDRKISASDLAALVGYSEYYLTEKFKAETGVSVSTYIRTVKIERAKVLLETTDLTIQEISDQLAFNTPNYFIQSFKSTVGCTPKAFRKKLQEDKTYH
ncbi:MAG: helix-turn-helix transcriptional regulator [Lachnospiraceae bacterium]|nr:helix-turn-helix transcriptional regulator [Lachnospiraceae bacterium]